MNKTYLSLSSNLFAMPNFIRGMSRTLDLGNTFDVYNYSDNEYLADQRALLSDWQQVGIDIANAMESFKHVE